VRRLVRHALRRAAAWDQVCFVNDGPDSFGILDSSEALRWRGIALRSAWMVHVMRGARLEP